MNTSNRAWSIAFACALGALIGSVAALQISNWGFPFFWPIGALIGGAVSWLIVDLRELIAGVASARKHMLEWQPYKPFWKGFVMVWFGFLMLTLTTFVLVGLLAWGMQYDIGADISRRPNLLAILLGFFLFIEVVLGSVFAAAVATTDRKDEDRLERALYAQRFGRDIALYFNPVGIVLFPTYYTIKGILWVIMNIKLIATTSWQFVKLVFRYVNSDVRYICFIGGGLGSAIGFFAGNAIIGAITGALLGVVLYLISQVLLKQASSN